MLTTHGDVPLQAPDHPLKLWPPAATAVSVTLVLGAKLALHVPVAFPAETAQLIPLGLLVTVPTPVPEPERESANGSAPSSSTGVPSQAAIDNAATAISAAPILLRRRWKVCADGRAGRAAANMDSSPSRTPAGLLLCATN
jgi:hypothetical protein